MNADKMIWGCLISGYRTKQCTNKKEGGRGGKFRRKKKKPLWEVIMKEKKKRNRGVVTQVF